MTRRALLSLSLSALMLGGTTVGCATDGGSHALASASSRGDVAADKNATAAAARADKALARNRPEEAVGFAESAVALRPGDAAYRVLLGRAYLKAGRFASARDAFTDVLALEPANGKAALNLALAQIGTGDWAGARHTLDAHQASVPAGDRGLALSLAGDPTTGTELLMGAARAPEADVTTRQNLALALALSGRWQESRAVAATDLSPADVDKRMAEWASFAQPTSASDQVATLLGVVPVVDAGQPVALALAAPVPAAARPVQTAAVAAPVSAPAPVAAQPDPAPAIALAAVEPASETEAAPALAPVIAAPARPLRIALTVPARTSGSYFIQFGAYQNAAVARDGWARIARRNATVAAHAPMGARFSTKAGNFYRLSIGGFSRPEATAMCRSYKAHGGDCFVRAGAGEQVASWSRIGRGAKVQLASR